MTYEDDSHEPVTVTDKRRVDPVTGEVRDPASDPSGSASVPEPGAESAPAEVDEAAELKSTLQRVKAEYDNYRKRSVRQEQDALDRGKAAVAGKLLTVLDDLERARSHGDLETGPLKSVADKLTAALESVGLVAFGAVGDEFDPSKHEAVQHDGDGSNPVIGTVMAKGYRLGEHKVLRNAVVGVVDSVDAPADGDAGAGEPAAEAD